MIQAWIAGVEARWTQELLRDGHRDAAMSHFARAEKEYRPALRLSSEQGPLQTELGTLYAIVGKPAEAVAAFEAAEAADYLDAAAAAHFARAYVALGRCADVERIARKVERALGVDGRSRELRAILNACVARPAQASR
jgi:tetratricopeptide (TPR) repeat protein